MLSMNKKIYDNLEYTLIC